MKKKPLAHFISELQTAPFLLMGVFAVPMVLAEPAWSAENPGRDIKFNTTFLDSSLVSGTDLSQFSRGNGVLPGTYRVDVYLNDDVISTENILFKKQDDGIVRACVPDGLLNKLAVSPDAIAGTGSEVAACRTFEESLPVAKVHFDPGSQQIVISVPQKYMQKSARGSVPSSLWQSGSSAAFLGYSASTFQTATQGKSFNSSYLGINSGVNMGEWYFRHTGSLTATSSERNHYQSLSTYVQHDITPLRGRFVVGQANTSGRLFDTLAFTGVSVFSDDQMLPDSQRDYAPEIRGVARSNARVTIRQAGNVIYETTVPAGAFVINDLYPTGYGGDLDVTVRESDGTQSTFQVPYASVAALMRPGAHRYEAVAGKYRTTQTGDGQPLYMATWQQGITNILTLYGGIQASDKYQAYLAGGAVSTPVGAVALDATQSHTVIGQQKYEGQSYRISYNKLISDTNSNIALAAYRFSTENYFDFMQAMEYQNLYRGDALSAAQLYRTKNRYSLTLSQGLPDGWGQVSASGISQNYWNRGGNDMQYQLAYSNVWGRVSWSVNASRSRSLSGATDTSWLLSFSMPLGDMRPATVGASLSRDAEGQYGQQVSVSGTAGEDQQMSWSVSGAHDAASGSSGGVSGQYLSPWTMLNGSASVSRSSHSFGAGMTGAIVAHPRGVTLTPYSSDGYMIISAPGAAGAKVLSYPGLELDHWGNAAVPQISPYQRNTLAIDPHNLPDTVELESTSESVVPRAGAVVVTRFGTITGHALLMMPSEERGSLPFGSNVTDAEGNTVGMVGQSGMIYVRVARPEGKLFATHIQGTRSQTCVIPYRLSDTQSAMQRITYNCGK